MNANKTVAKKLTFEFSIASSKVFKKGLTDLPFTFNSTKRNKWIVNTKDIIIQRIPAINFNT